MGGAAALAAEVVVMVLVDAADVGATVPYTVVTSCGGCAVKNMSIWNQLYIIIWVTCDLYLSIFYLFETNMFDE